MVLNTKSMMKKIVLCWLLLIAVNGCVVAQRVIGNNSSNDPLVDMVLDKVALLNGEEAFERMRMKYRFKKADSARLKQLFMERELDKIVPYKVGLSATQTMEYKNAADSAYSDSIYRYLIPYNKISSENLTCALKFAKRIKLDEAQYEYLMSCALKMAHRLEKDPLKNVWNEEFDVLEKSLTYKQLRDMLILKHKTAIQKEMDQVWTQLEEANLIEGVDSAKEYSPARMHIALRYCINDVYRHKSGERRNNLEELKRNRPLLIKMYDALEQRKKEKKEEEDYREFVW